MDLLIRGIPAVVLLVTGAISVVGGVLFPFGMAANNGPASGQISAGFVAIGLALITGGIAIIWVAWGVWCSKIWRTRGALGLSAAVLAYMAWVLSRSLTAMGSVRNPITGQMQPQYDGRAGAIVLAILVYLMALACLILVERRQRRTVST